MDEYEKLAFELDMLLHKAKRSYPRQEFDEGVLRDARDEFRFLSRTWRKPTSSFAPKENDGNLKSGGPPQLGRTT